MRYDINKNYYGILGVDSNSTEKEIKKSFYKLSFDYHPDKGGDVDSFNLIKEAYEVLTGELREKWDTESKFGSKYDEIQEFLKFDFQNDAKLWDGDKLEEWKSKNQLNIVIKVGEDFDGSVQYERWVTCKKCGGDGKDTSSKIQIKDENGKIIKMFEGSDGCDFCEGSGNSWDGNPCYFCGGKGKVGYTSCKSCDGEKRILGRQKINGIKFSEKEKSKKIPAMGHISKNEIGKSGDLWIIRSI